jgi:hypothetical protein
MPKGDESEEREKRRKKMRNTQRKCDDEALFEKRRFDLLELQNNKTGEEKKR